MLVCEFNARIYICLRAAGWLQRFEPNYKGHVDIYIYNYESIFFLGLQHFKALPSTPHKLLLILCFFNAQKFMY